MTTLRQQRPSRFINATSNLSRKILLLSGAWAWMMAWNSPSAGSPPAYASAFVPESLRRRCPIVKITFDRYPSLTSGTRQPIRRIVHHATTDNEEDDVLSGIIELADDPQAETLPPPPTFISQGEVLPKEDLSPDLSDGQQVRVIIYIILALVPVLFLVPLILGSRDLIPQDMLPPVEL
mmetsp:Transcript_26304/g.52425  ORF Transcript_26304/g.52425 Transcript_26304/m.52425 type:complete len:179 (-) Transcript_26304:245-781(-)